MSVTETHERRDVEARLARDRLAGLVGVHPREIGSLRAEVASVMAIRYESMSNALAAAQTDDLTGALIRSAGMARICGELARAERLGDPAVVLFIDMDGLKTLNDTHGHSTGDRALRLLGSTMAQNLRPYDIVSRWGGDEFVVCLPGCDMAQAAGIAGRITGEFHQLTKQTITVGYAEPQRHDSPESVIARADHDMYQRKRQALGAAPARRD